MAQGLTLAVDSSVWIAFYRSANSPAKQWLHQAIRNHTVIVPDLVLVEVLRGIDHERDAKAVAAEFEAFEVVTVGGLEMALKSARNYRHLRAKAVTVRGTVDLVIATWCIENGIPLISTDRDFRAFEKHLGLKLWRGDEPLPELV